MRNKRTDKDALLAKWLNGELTSDEVKVHLSKDEFLKYKQIIEEVDRWTPDHDEEIIDHQTIVQNRKKAKVVKMPNWKIISIAASVVIFILAGYAYWSLNSDVTYQTAFGESLTITLPDGSSTMVLAANSKASWSKTNWRKKKRQVKLRGKAYFNVPEKGTFNVITSEGTIAVLGTRFVVNQIEQALHAICFEGRVRATSKSQKAIELNKGESSIFYDGKWDPIRFFNLSLPPWIGDQVTFDNVPLKFVVEELIALYGLEVDLGNINLARRFTGSIPNDNLDQALKIIFPTLGMTYRLEDNILYLSE